MAFVACQAGVLKGDVKDVLLLAKGPRYPDFLLHLVR